MPRRAERAGQAGDQGGRRGVGHLPQPDGPVRDPGGQHLVARAEGDRVHVPVGAGHRAARQDRHNTLPALAHRRRPVPAHQERPSFRHGTRPTPATDRSSSVQRHRSVPGQPRQPEPRIEYRTAATREPATASALTVRARDAHRALPERRHTVQPQDRHIARSLTTGQTAACAGASGGRQAAEHWRFDYRPLARARRPASSCSGTAVPEMGMSAGRPVPP